VPAVPLERPAADGAINTVAVRPALAQRGRAPVLRALPPTVVLVQQLAVLLVLCRDPCLQPLRMLAQRGIVLGLPHRSQVVEQPLERPLPCAAPQDLIAPEAGHVVLQLS